MVLTQWQILCLPRLNACIAPQWMLYYPSYMLIISLLLQASLDTHKIQALQLIQDWFSPLQYSTGALYFL